MWPLRIIALLGCAEWLLIFRTWVSLRYLLLYAAFAALRLLYFLNLFPHADNNYILAPVSVLAILYHLRLLWRAQTSHNQQTYNTPETGVPWLVIVARNPKRALALEFTIILAFIFFMAQYGRLIYPPGFATLPPPVQAWLSPLANAKTFAAVNAVWMLFAYSLWNLAVSGVPLWRPRAAERVAEDAYQYVREQNHTPPGLPSVKNLSDNLRDFYL